MADKLNDIYGQALAELQPQGDTQENTQENTAEGQPDNSAQTAQDTAQPQPDTNQAAQEAQKTAEEVQVEQAQKESVPTQTQQAAQPEQAAMAKDANALLQINLRTAEALKKTQDDNAKLKQQLDEMMNSKSSATQEQVQQTLLEPPQLDFSKLQYMDDAVRQTEIRSYNKAMADYAAQQVLKQIAPQLQPIQQQYEQTQKMQQENTVKSAMAKDAKLPGFTDNLDLIERIRSTNPALQNLSPQDSYKTAYLIAQGVNALNNPPKARTSDDIVNEALNNPDVMRALETRRAKQISDANANLPQFAASQGTANIPATPAVKPKTIDEAGREARKSLGLI